MLNDILQGFVAYFKDDYDGLEDRRQVIRLRCRYSVYIIYRKKPLEATVVDMGVKGLRLDILHRLKPDSQVAVLYRAAVRQKPVISAEDIEKDYQAAVADHGVVCRVAWCRRDPYSGQIQTGIEFDDTPERMAKSWVKTILKETGFDRDSIHQKRKNVRVPASIKYECDTISQGLARGTVLNLGAGGALLQAEQELPDGVNLIIGPYKDLDKLYVSGKVVSRRQDSAGQHFLHGVQFFDTSNTATELLGSYVRILLEESQA